MKFTNTASAKITVTGTLDCQTGPYRPAIFTSKDDNTVGDAITGSTGAPTNYNGATYLEGPSAYTTYQYLRLSYAATAIDAYSPQEVKHCQFIRCGTAIAAGDDTDLHLRNVLFSMCGTAVSIGSGNSLTGEHVTADQVNKLFDAPSVDTCKLTNSILTAVTNIGTNVTLYSCATNSSGTSFYQTVGGASYYLAVSSTNRNAGTTNINTTLLGELRKKTTYPPVEITTNFTGNTTLGIQAARGRNTPDRGYQYDPLDFVVSGRMLTNSTLTLTNGVVLGTYGSSSSYEIYIRKGGNLVSEGSPTNLNQIVRYNTVQEQATTNWSAASVADCISISGDTSPVPQGSFRFTGWSLLGGKGDHFKAYVSITTPFIFKDCQFGPGAFESLSSVAIMNCLFERVSTLFYDENEAINYYAYNSLYRGGRLELVITGSGTWQFKDNLFDQTTIPHGGGTTHGYNGYVTNQNRLSPNGTGDVILTNAPVYKTSVLGNYYYPNTNDGMLNLLIDTGSRNATNAGLYHYTTRRQQQKELISQVDIGFHYVALNSNGAPFDSDLDGLPDYLADKNGNGTADAGETDWGLIATSTVCPTIGKELILAI